MGIDPGRISRRGRGSILAAQIPGGIGQDNRHWYRLRVGYIAVTLLDHIVSSVSGVIIVNQIGDGLPVYFQRLGCIIPLVSQDGNGYGIPDS